MKVLFFLLILLAPVLGFSSVGLYQVSVKSNYEGGDFSKQKFILKEDQSINYVDAHKNFIEVVVNEYEIGEGKNIKLNFVVSRENEDGEMIVLSSPKIITQQNKKSEIETITEDGGKVSLIVKAKRL